MIASLLPGLRDLRVPLAAGAMWLVVLWLATYPLIPTKEDATGLAGAIYRLTDAFGPAGFTAALMFVAFLIGILAVPLTVGPTGRLAAACRVLASFSVVRALTGKDPLGRAVTRLDPPMIAPISLSTYWEAQALVNRTEDRVRGHAVVPAPSPERAILEQDDEGALRRRIYRDLEEDIPLVATRLLAHNRELFDRYDRAAAESAFRFVIAPPLLLVGVIVPMRLGVNMPGFVLCISIAVAAVLLLIFDGGRKQIESNDAIFQAVFIGEASFPSIDFINQGLAAAGNESRPDKPDPSELAAED